MTKLDEINLILRKKSLKLNSLYKDEDNEIVMKALQLCSLPTTKTAKLAVLRRIVDLKSEALVNELKNLKVSEEESEKILKKIYDYCANFHSKLHKEMIEEIKEKELLDAFNLALLENFHKIGLKMNDFFKVWEEKIIDENAKYFKENFSDLAEVRKFLSENSLIFKNPDGSFCDRSYGSVFLENGELVLKTYAAAFPKEMKEIEEAFHHLLKTL